MVVPTQDCAASVQACALRVAALDIDGAILPGSKNLYVTEGIIQFVATQEVAQGQNLRQENGSGLACVRYRTPDVVDRYNCTLAICSPDPELQALLIGGEANGNKGYKFPKLGTVENPYGVSLELWSKAIIDGELAPVDPYFWWAVTRAHFQPGRDVTLENGITANSFTGYCEENPNWFNGPANDWSADSDRAIQFDRTDSFPEGACGAQSLAGS